MSSQKRRITNPEPFLPLGSDAFSAKKPKPAKRPQTNQELVPSSVSSKILKEARRQQKEIEDEEDEEKNKVSDQNPDNKLRLPQFHGLKDKDDEEDVDDFDGFSETQSQFGQFDPEDGIDEEDEKLLDVFMKKEDHSQRTLADIIVEKIKKNDAQVSSGVQPMPKLDDTIIELYKGGKGFPMGKRNRAAVVVLGDIGRSPRMQYHALSLARQACLDVDIVAYGGSEPHISLLQHQSIHIHKMPQWPAFPRSLPKLLRPLFLILKPIFQFLVLLWYLCVKIPAPDVFIVQNPPSVPTLVVVKWASWFRHSAFIVDWHNFGYTLLALSLGRNSLFVAMYRWIEKRFGKMAHGSLCVTRAMQHELSHNWGIKATVLYDQPPEFFRPASIAEKHNLFCRISKSINKPDGLRDCVGNGLTGEHNNDPNTTPFTTRAGSDILLRQNRPVLVVSSTSWTPDEDFGILLEAALMYDRRVAALLGENDSTGNKVVWDEILNGKQFTYPRLLFIITGKGPEKEKYDEKIRKLRLKRVAFRTMWLSAEDYPLLLGSADLGVCLHTSSSGLDLPMKVVDMFGCGLPVCAVSYSCIKELVDVEKNGLLFSSSTELAEELMMLFEGFPEKCDALKLMSSNLMKRVSLVRWATAWDENAKPLIYEVISQNSS